MRTDIRDTWAAETTALFHFIPALSPCFGGLSTSFNMVAWWQNLPLRSGNVPNPGSSRLIQWQGHRNLRANELKGPRFPPPDQLFSMPRSAWLFDIDNCNLYVYITTHLYTFWICVMDLSSIWSQLTLTAKSMTGLKFREKTAAQKMVRFHRMVQ